MDLLTLRTQIDQAQVRLTEIASNLDRLAASDVEALSSELLPLLNCLNPAPGQTPLPPLNLAPHQYQSILDSASVGIAIYDRHKIIRYVNQRAIQYIGYDPTGEFRDEYLQKLTLTDWTGRPLSIYARPATLVWEGVQARDVQMMITNTQGQVFKVLVAAIPFYQGKEFAGAAVIWNDVTLLEQALVEIKRREEQLRESEERFRIALANASIFVATQDRDLRYTWFYSPYYPEEAQWVSGQRMHEDLPEADLPELVERKRQVIETGVGFRQEISVTVRGEQRVFDITCEPLRDHTGAVTGLSSAWVDLTQQRSLEARQDEYAARIALHHRLSEQHRQDLLHFGQRIHDRPLQDLISLVAAVQLAREMASENQVTQILGEIERQSKDLADDLRTICRELNPPTPTRFGLKRAIYAHIQDLRKRCPGIAFDLRLMEDILKLPDVVCLALYRIYREAVQNAVQHAAANTISVRLTFRSKEITLEIEDDGVGFTPCKNWMELIHNGQFGMVNIKEQCDSIHANLSFVSTPGNGTLVSVTVPN